MKRGNVRSVIITGPGYEDPEVIVPLYWLQILGSVDVVTSSDQDVKSKHGYPLKPTIRVADLKVNNYDAVIIPGGLEAPDRVRQVGPLVTFVRAMFEAGKLVSSTCHGPWVLIEAGVVKGRKVTGYRAIKTDLVNAGAEWIGGPVVIDDNLITSDHPRSITPWMQATVDALKKS